MEYILLFLVLFAIGYYIDHTFSYRFYSRFGARKELKDIRWDLLHLFPPALLAILNSRLLLDWHDLLAWTVNLCTILISLMFIIELIRWQKTPKAMDVPLNNFFMTNIWPNLESIVVVEDDEVHSRVIEFWKKADKDPLNYSIELFQEDNWTVDMILPAYLDYLQSTGHELIEFQKIIGIYFQEMIEGPPCWITFLFTSTEEGLQSRHTIIFHPWNKLCAFMVETVERSTVIT